MIIAPLTLFWDQIWFVLLWSFCQTRKYPPLPAWAPTSESAWFGKKKGRRKHPSELGSSKQKFEQTKGATGKRMAEAAEAKSEDDSDSEEEKEPPSAARFALLVNPWTYLGILEKYRTPPPQMVVDMLVPFFKNAPIHWKPFPGPPEPGQRRPPCADFEIPFG